MRPVVISLFDYTGVAVQPWAAAGYECWCFDLQHDDKPRTERHGAGSITFAKADLSGQSGDWAKIVHQFVGHSVSMVFGFPPCTDLAASGARHWANKRAADPLFQDKAVAMAVRVSELAKALRAPFMIENPNGALSTLWRAADYSFNPHQFGGYLPADDQHPLWPEYIPPRDAYTKRTRLWTGNGFVMPQTDSIPPIVVEYVKQGGMITRGSPQWGKLGGKSLKTKNIRSATPRGFALAVFLANHRPALAKAA